MDDTNTWEFAFVRLAPGEENTYRTNPSPVVRTNYGDRPYEERQRYPGDYEAQVSQRPIARHTLEHLGATDRGVTMMRKMIREGIRAVKCGEDPKGVWREANGPIPTYGNDTVLRVPAAPSAEADSEVLKKIARQIAERSLEHPPSYGREFVNV